MINLIIISFDDIYQNRGRPDYNLIAIETVMLILVNTSNRQIETNMFLNKKKRVRTVYFI